MFEKLIELVEAGKPAAIGVGAWFDFRSQPMAVWEGYHRLDATRFCGHTFDPTNGLGRVGPLELGAIKPTKSIVFTLIGLDPTMHAIAMAQALEIKRRDCAVFYFVFDRSGGKNELVEVEQVAAPIMDRIITRVDTTTSPRRVTLDLIAEPLFSDKNRAPYGLLSYADWKRRYPGEEGLYLVQRVATPSEPFVWV